jgi:hypothetical protein
MIPTPFSGTLKVAAVRGLGLVLLALASCKGPEFYERRDLGRPVMLFEQDVTMTHFFQKTFYAIEGAAGGIGSSGGGGCGCN